MLYSKTTTVSSNTSLAEMMETKMHEDDAEYLEQGVNDKSCMGDETPILTSKQEFDDEVQDSNGNILYAQVNERVKSTSTRNETDSNLIERCLVEGDINIDQSKIKSNANRLNDGLSNANLSMLLESGNLEENKVSNSQKKYISISKLSEDYFFIDNNLNDKQDENEMSSNRVNDFKSDTTCRTSCQKYLTDVYDSEESQTGCTSSESMRVKLASQRLTYVQSCENISCNATSNSKAIIRQQSASQPTFEVQYLSPNDPNDHHMNSIELQVIREDREARFPKSDVSADKIDKLSSQSKKEAAPSMKSSKSMDRLLSEAAQFAEAVGEIPPSNVNEISRCIIDAEEDEDDDDSDSDNDNSCNETETEILPAKEKHKANRISIIENNHFTSTPNADVNMNKLFTAKDSRLGLSLDETNLHISKLPDSNVISKRERSKSLDDSSQFRTTSFNTTSRSTFNIQRLQPLRFKSFHVTEKSLLGGLPTMDGTEVHNEGRDKKTSCYVYRGLKSNPPAIIQNGLSRGNYAQLHRKAWLEVSDKYHRYGKNLRLYYKHWEKLNHPTNMFFDWLDSKGEAAGQTLPNLDECPRSRLDSDTVLYITNPDITARYKLSITKNPNNESVYIADSDGNPINTGAEGWIFVLRDGVLYAAPKVTSITGKSKQRFHHSSFFGGKAVAAAGIIITGKDGVLQRLYPHSGHYRPGEAHMHRMLFFLQKRGIDLFSFQVDTQQIMHVSRKERKDSTPKGGKGDEKTITSKAKKINSLNLRSGATVACFLAHKAHMIGNGIFCQIQMLRRIKEPLRVGVALKYIRGEGVK